MDYIYLDNEASTPVDSEVVNAMMPYFTERYGMASSEFGHSQGVEGRRAIENARKIIAGAINAKPNEIFLTSGVAESNNWAIRGALLAKRGNVITSTIEQNTILNVLSFLEEDNSIKATRVGVDKEGFVDLAALGKSIDKDTRLVSIQHANQEIGTIQDVTKIGKMCRDAGVLFHTDASNSFLRVPIDVQKMNIDLMTISAHNIYGPKGIGALFIREGIGMKPLLYGGGEQGGMRPGLEDVPSIVGFGRAIEVYNKADNDRMKKLRDRLIKGLLSVKDTRLNGPTGDKRVCNNVNVTFKYIEGESILLHSDMRGCAITTGSACFSRDLVPSHVITSLGMSHADAHGSVRFTLSKYTTEKEIDYVVTQMKDIVKKLREISPLHENEK